MLMAECFIRISSTSFCRLIVSHLQNTEAAGRAGGFLFGPRPAERALPCHGYLALKPNPFGRSSSGGRPLF
jgi:hypothetical protein